MRAGALFESDEVLLQDNRYIFKRYTKLITKTKGLVIARLNEKGWFKGRQEASL